MPEQPATLAEALLAVQARLPRITKDSEAQVGTRTYPYANLATIHDAVMPLLGELGLYWVTCPTLLTERQGDTSHPGPFVLRYELRHALTDSVVRGDYPLPESGTPQQIGSAITYARRYCLTAVLGIAPVEDDDDGQAAEQAATWRPPANPRTRKADRHRVDRDGPVPDDEWTTPPEDSPGSSTTGQRTAIGIMFTRLRITDRQDRLASVMSMLDLPELESSTDLSYNQAQTLIGKLEAMLSEEGKP